VRGLPAQLWAALFVQLTFRVAGALHHRLTPGVCSRLVAGIPWCVAAGRVWRLCLCRAGNAEVVRACSATWGGS